MKFKHLYSSLFVFFALLVALATSSDNKVDELRKQVDELKGIMAENIKMALKNLDTTEDMVAQADELVDQANIFKKTVKKLNWKMRFAKYKHQFVAGTVLASVAAVPVHFLLVRFWRFVTAIADIKKMSGRKQKV